MQDCGSSTPSKHTQVVSFKICCANRVSTSAMWPKLFHIQALYVFVSLLCVCVFVVVDYVQYPVAGKETTLASDVSVRLPNSRRLALCHLVVSMCGCKHMSVHYLGPSYYISNTAARSSLWLSSVQVLNAQLSSCRQLTRIRPV